MEMTNLDCYQNTQSAEIDFAHKDFLKNPKRVSKKAYGKVLGKIFDRLYLKRTDRKDIVIDALLWQLSILSAESTRWLRKDTELFSSKQHVKNLISFRSSLERTFQRGMLVNCSVSVRVTENIFIMFANVSCSEIRTTALPSFAWTIGIVLSCGLQTKDWQLKWTVLTVMLFIWVPMVWLMRSLKPRESQNSFKLRCGKENL